MVSLDRITGLSRGMRKRFSFGGVALELLLEPGFTWALPAETERHMSAHCAAPELAAVTCSVRVDSNLVPPSMDDVFTVKWEQRPDGVRVRSPQIVLDIAALGPRRYIVAARIGHASLLTLLLNTLAASIAELAGGLCLHATAVAHARGAVLLLGPSGAGKSTAAGLLGSDIACLANDRVTLVPDPAIPGKYWVWSLPVGKPPENAQCGEVALPLAALLRVIKAAAPEVSPVREVEALMHIRQAVEVGESSDFFEPERLGAVAALAAAATSGVARVSLAGSWRAQLDSFLEGAMGGRVRAQSSTPAARADGAKP